MVAAIWAHKHSIQLQVDAQEWMGQIRGALGSRAMRPAMGRGRGLGLGPGELSSENRGFGLGRRGGVGSTPRRN